MSTDRIQPGDACPECAVGRMRTISSRRASDGWQTRYLQCVACDWRTKTLSPIAQVWRRAERSIVEQLPLNDATQSGQ